jgi:hypothetical protein
MVLDLSSGESRQLLGLQDVAAVPPAAQLALNASNVTMTPVGSRMLDDTMKDERLPRTDSLLLHDSRVMLSSKMIVQRVMGCRIGCLVSSASPAVWWFGWKVAWCWRVPLALPCHELSLRFGEAPPIQLATLPPIGALN